MVMALLAGCLFDRATYEARLRELTDADGDGYALEADCDDDAPGVSPAAVEVCDGVDQDCDGEVDDGFSGIAELCNGQDDDCDGTTDEDGLDGTPWYNDADGDGFGLASALVLACTAPPGFVADAGDCDDGNPARHPGGVEVPYDGIDQDCDGADLIDVDGDGYPALLVGGFDCDDEDTAVYPNATETWEDGFVDNDCDPGTEGALRAFGTDVYTGRGALAHAGGALAPLGDLDADGREELAVAAFYDDAGGQSAGAVHLLSGTDPAPLGSFPTLEGEAGDYLGTSIDAADLDDDGVGDLLVGATGRDAGVGAVLIIGGGDLPTDGAVGVSAIAQARVTGPHAGAYLGSQVEAAGDLDGDGLPEVAVSAPLANVGALEAAGAVWVLDAERLASGESVAVDDVVIRYEGAEAWDIAGNGVQSGGDQDGDGLPDLVVWDSIDELWLVPGGAAAGTLDDRARARVAEAVGDCRVLGDLDGDSLSDVLVLGSEAYLLTDLTAQPVWTREGATAQVDLAGDEVSDAIDLGDRDEDGAPEIVLFAERRASNATGWVGVTRSADWFYGSTITDADIVLEAVASRPESGFGYRAAPAGDLGGDGKAWFAVGGWLDDESGTDAGAVALLPVPGE